MREEEGRSGRRLRWIAWVALAEVLILLVSVKAYLPSRHARRTGREGNTIARLVLDDPGMLESLVFYVVITHAAVGALLLVAHLSARKKRRLATERTATGAGD